MSLTSFLRRPEVTAKVKLLRPRVPRTIPAPLRIEPRSRRYMLVGTAFDYLLRFELQRQAPYAITEQWIAEHALSFLWYDGERFGVKSHVFADSSPDEGMPPEEREERAYKVVGDAKAAVATYVESKGPHATMPAELAAHAIRLAKLDAVYRAGYFDPRFEEANSEDVQDLLDLLTIVPFDSLRHTKVLFLNPDFRDSSRLVGGADADLITGDLLVDFKTTKKGEIQGQYLDQLLGYYLLARNQRRMDPTFPVLNRLGLYYCRHGYLWTLDAAVWTDNPQFPEIEEWFFQHAKEVFVAR